jgi:hypothetical protein
MTPEDISDRETLERWLQGRAERDAVAIAHRSALRVLPAWIDAMSEDWAHKRSFSALPVLRGLLTVGVLRAHPDQRSMYGLRAVLSDMLSALPRHEAVVAASSEAQRAATERALRSGSIEQDVETADIRAQRTVEAAAEAITTAGNAIRAAVAKDKEWCSTFAIDTFMEYVSSTRAEEQTAYFLSLGYRTDSSYGGPEVKEAVASCWKELAADARRCIDGTEDLAPLLAKPSMARTGLIDRMRTEWAPSALGQEFWMRWYQGFLDGKPLPWELQRDIALIPDDDWQKGAAHIAGLIEEIELRQVDAAIPNGERVEVDPETGRLQLVPETDIPLEIAYARRKIAKAAALFGDSPGNQYSALVPDLAMLREAVELTGALPVELYDACASASRRLTQRMGRGECPPDQADALVADYQLRIRDAATDILAHDPVTRDVLARRNAITGNAALIEAAAAIRGAAALIPPVAQGALVVVIPRDVALATDPASDADDRKAASLRLSSRMLRIGKVVAVVARGGYAAVLGTNQILKAIAEIAASPLFQAARNAILRYLGF